MRAYAQRSRGAGAMIAAATDWLSHYDALIAPLDDRRRAGRAATAAGDPSCCTLASLLGAPAITLPDRRATRAACRSARSSSPRRRRTRGCSPWRRGARRGCRSRASR
ncbi:MAG: hypothetical protein MZW92_32940 [Comamonadaceae bacterium]|nr:hypothetical protein [Comamonadaceae bacterium]